MSKIVKYSITIILVVFLAYHSVYFKKLDEVQASSTDFKARSYARNYFDSKLLPASNNAVDINQLITLIRTDRNGTFDKYAHALGIGNIRYFLVKGEGEVTAINENDISITVNTDTTKNVYLLATEFVFGNALRDASGKININEFSNTMDFNNVSSEINKIVRTEILPPFRSKVKQGDVVQFAGAIELNQVHLNLNEIEVIPVQLKILQKNGTSSIVN